MAEPLRRSNQHKTTTRNRAAILKVVNDAAWGIEAEEIERLTGFTQPVVRRYLRDLADEGELRLITWDSTCAVMAQPVRNR